MQILKMKPKNLSDFSDENRTCRFHFQKSYLKNQIKKLELLGFIFEICIWKIIVFIIFLEKKELLGTSGKVW